MTKLNKVKGEKANCPSCNEPIICVEKPAQGEYAAKLQWQDRDEATGESTGKAHYNYNFTTKKVDPCPGAIIEDPKNVRRPEVVSTPKTTDISPEVLRQESFSDFDKVYSEAIPKAREIALAMTIGQPKNETELRIIIQCILKSYIHFYIARNL